jgi:hypothetical protein
MCFNAPVSIASFFVGTLLNIYLYMVAPHISVKIIALVWQYSIIMQLLDYFSWTSECPSTQQTISSKLSYFFNITQPIFFLIIGLYLLPNLSLSVKFMAIMVSIFYLGYVLSQTKEITSCVKELNVCGHLNYSWWNQIHYGGTIYTLTLIALTLLLLPTQFGLYQLAYIVTTLAISTIMYGCGTPSVWCFFQVFAPIYTLLILRTNISFE